MNVRTAAAKVLGEVISHGHSLSAALPQWQERVADKDRALLQELCYGVLRWYQRLDAIAEKLLTKSLKRKDSDVRCLLLLGLYQLIYLRVPDHASVSETVAAAGKLRKPWARGLTNAVLRGYQRQSEALLAEVDADETVRLSHPAWFVDMLRETYPNHWQAILDANNQYPPMCLRVNCQKIARDEYLQQLDEQGIAAEPLIYSDDGLMLTQSVDVELLPRFSEGWASVQDSAAQLAALLLDAKPGERVLDACAAPGGKTAHVLERQPDLAEMVALDSDKHRLQRLEENFKRLDLSANVVVADAAVTDSWWDGQLFDRIMLDAPCSASGVIRRHPDIKLLRRAEDIAQLAEIQGQILRALWPLLKPGGILLYVTCSVLPQENVQQLQQFCTECAGAQEEPIQADWGVAQIFGRQILPGQDGMDGFYYARLRKNETVAEG